MRKLLTILFLVPFFIFGQNLNVKVFRTHAGNGNSSQYPNYANSRTDMDKMVSTAYSNTTLWWNGTMAATTCLNWNTWTVMSSAGASIPNNGEFFSVEVSGVFTPVETGTYFFGVNSDDGADLIINNVLVSTYYGGHGMGGYQIGSISLVAGTPYTFVARIQEYGGGEGLAVAWRRPSQANYTLQSAELGISVPLATISGTVSVPVLTSYPSLSLYRISGTSETLVETKTVASNGTYSFTVPVNNTVYKIYPSLVIQGITSTDFNLVWGEVKNINTPNVIASGLIMTGTKQWKAGDVNRNGILDVGDAFLVAAHLTGLRPVNQVLWFNMTNYDTITRANFATIAPVTSFTINVVTSNLTQNIKYCILGDINLSHSSQ
jgi:hypothetical protein